MIKQLAIVGDSLAQGVVASVAIAQGGTGGWTELLGERLANLAGVGPLVSSGFRSCSWLNGNANNVNYWEFTTGGDAWTAVVSTDAWDKLPYGLGQYANGSTKIGTATLPATYRAAVGFALTWVDYTNGGNWQYSTDGGSNWLNHNQTLAHDNTLKKFYVNTAIARGGTVKVRAYDGASGVGCFPAGIEWFYLPPSTASGFILQNYSWGGRQLHQLCLATSGDRMAVLDSVTLGTGSPISSTANVGSVMLHVNDVGLLSTSGWATDLTTWNTRATSWGPVGLIAPHECNLASYDQTQQTSNRAQTATSAAGFSPAAKVYDIYTAWAGKGFTGNAAGVAAGLLRSAGDLTHQTQLGQLDYAERLYWFVRNQILGLGNVQSTYTATAKQAAVAYSAKQAAVAYSAGAPIGVG